MGQNTPETTSKFAPQAAKNAEEIGKIRVAMRNLVRLLNSEYTADLSPEEQNRRARLSSETAIVLEEWKREVGIDGEENNAARVRAASENDIFGDEEEILEERVDEIQQSHTDIREHTVHINRRRKQLEALLTLRRHWTDLDNGYWPVEELSADPIAFHASLRRLVDELAVQRGMVLNGVENPEDGIALRLTNEQLPLLQEQTQEEDQKNQSNMELLLRIITFHGSHPDLHEQTQNVTQHANAIAKLFSYLKKLFGGRNPLPESHRGLRIEVTPEILVLMKEYCLKNERDAFDPSTLLEYIHTAPDGPDAHENQE